MVNCIGRKSFLPSGKWYSKGGCDLTNNGNGAKIFGIALVALLLFGIIGFFTFTTRISTGEACVQKRFGKLIGGQSAKPVEAGLHYRNPATTTYTCYSLRKRIYEVGLVAPKDRTGSNADYKDFVQDARTKEGLDIQVAYVAQYHTDANQVGKLYRVGYRDQAAIDEKAMKYYVRLIVPQVLSRYTNQDIYQGDLNYISQNIYNELYPILLNQGVILDSFGLKDRNFPDSYEEAIQNKSIKNEQIEAKKLEQQYADAEAERQRKEAQGQADAQVINAKGQAESERVVLETRAKVLEQYPVLVTWHNIDAYYNQSKVYLPSNALPLVPIEGMPTTKQ